MARPDPAADVVALVDQLIRAAIAARATDVHFEPLDDGVAVRFRVDALLHDAERLPAQIAPNVVTRLKVLAGLLTYRSDVPQEGAIARDARGFGCDIRVATFPTVRGERVVLRLLGDSVALRSLDELGLAAEVVARLEDRLARPQGLLVVCGPAGSGKTTTLYALLDHVLSTQPGLSVLSIEDPVEIRLERVTQVEVAPARGLTYPVALRSLLRQDPQVLMVGEIRDAETAQIVIEAALTGHLLLTTLHSGSAGEAIVRLREMGVPPYQITSTLSGVLVQRLLRMTCAGCRGAGCARCVQSGLAGRTAVGALVEMSAALRAAILGGADAAELETGAAALRAAAERLCAAGRTTRAEVERVLGKGE